MKTKKAEQYFEEMKKLLISLQEKSIYSEKNESKDVTFSDNKTSFFLEMEPISISSI